MKAFLDTNVLVAACVRQHPHFARADQVLAGCMTGDISGIVHAHSLLEFHSAITQLPKGLAVPPAQVPALLEEGILPYVEVVASTAEEVTEVQKRAGELALVGGIIYDLYHLAAAERHEVERFYTFNTGHFQSLSRPDFMEKIVAP